ncbi:hypothetical protein HUN42_00026 [Streptomyces phage Dagobah]|nr:hypothetical protein HUN42_00026 [Streptomyces phage Dagobah]
MSGFFRQAPDYELRCRATVAGEPIEVRCRLTREAYQDPGARAYAERELRTRLVEEILKRVNPKIEAQEVSPAGFPGIL